MQFCSGREASNEVMMNQFYLDVASKDGDVLETLLVDVELQDGGKFRAKRPIKVECAERDFVFHHVVVRSVTGRFLCQTKIKSGPIKLKARDSATLTFPDDVVATIIPSGCLA